MEDARETPEHVGAAPEPLRASWRSVLAPFLASRLILVLAVVLAAAVFSPRSGQRHGPDPAWANSWARSFARWDAGFYLNIAGHGYRFREGRRGTAGFFPLYPMLMRWATFGSTDRTTLAVAGLIISNLSTLLAFFLLYRMVARDYGRSVARRTLGCLAFFPTGFYLGVVYSEGLFLLTSVGAFWCARRGAWLGAGLLGALAGATRIIGSFLVVPLALAWKQRRASAPFAGVAALLLVPCGFLASMLLLHHAVGDPLAFARVQEAAGRATSIRKLVEVGARVIGDPVGSISSAWILVDAAFTLLAFVLLALGARRIARDLTVYAAGLVLIPLLNLQVAGMPRYVVVAFPLFIVMALGLRNPRAYRAAITVGGLLQLILAARWSLGYHVA